jgi:hypothetical protein
MQSEVSVRHVVPLILVALTALLACKLGLKAEVTGYKPDANTVVIVHVKTAKRALVSCSGRGLQCDSRTADYNGEVDLEIDLEGQNSSVVEKVVHLESKSGPRRGTHTLDVKKGLPSKVGVDPYGRVECVGRNCKGNLVLAPAARLTIDTEPGTVAELGSERFTADASGKIDTVVALATNPPLKDLPLSVLCASDAKSLGSTTLTLTFPDGAKLSANVALDTQRVFRPLQEAFKGLATGKVLFGWETARAPDVPKQRRAALFMGLISCTPGGPSDATLADLVVVARAELETREDTCVYHLTDKKTGSSEGTASGKLTLNDANATAYNRLTGATLGSRTFNAPKQCDDSLILGGSKHISPQSSYFSDASVAAWAATLSK